MDNEITILPDGALANFDLLYDIKTFEELAEAISTGWFQGEKLDKEKIKCMKNLTKIFHIEDELDKFLTDIRSKQNG